MVSHHICIICWASLSAHHSLPHPVFNHPLLPLLPIVSSQAVRSSSFNGQSAYHRDGGVHGLEKVYPNPHPYYNAPRVNTNVNGGHNGGHHGNLPRGNMNRPYAVVDFRGMPSVVAHGSAGPPMPPAAYEAARRGHIQHRVQQQQQQQYRQQGQADGVMMPGFSMWRGPVMYAPAGVYHHHQQPVPVGVMRQ